MRKSQIIFIAIISLLALFVSGIFVRSNCAIAQSCYKMRGPFVLSGWIPQQSDGGGCDNYAVTVTDIGLQDRVVGRAMLKSFNGWYTGEHNIDELKIVQSTPVIDPNIGSATWQIEYCLNDKNDDDNFDWTIEYVLFAY